MRQSHRAKAPYTHPAVKPSNIDSQLLQMFFRQQNKTAASAAAAENKTIKSRSERSEISCEL